MAHRLDDVAAAGLALAANHRRAFGDPPQRFAEIARTAHERHLELVLVDVVLVVGRRQHFGFVDEVDAERLQRLRLGQVTDAHLGHDRDRHRVHDPRDQLEVAHARDAAVAARISAGIRSSAITATAPGLLGDQRLLGRHDVHDDAALEHLRQTALDRDGPGLLLRIHSVHCPRNRLPRNAERSGRCGGDGLRRTSGAAERGV